jgi:hypothetical protein
MQRPSIPPDGKCKQDPSRTECPLACRYNHFESEDEDLVIDAWELKCLECGWRDTVGYRSDEPDPDAADDFNPKACPFCTISGLKAGRNPCESCDQNPST